MDDQRTRKTLPVNTVGRNGGPHTRQMLETPAHGNECVRSVTLKNLHNMLFLILGYPTGEEHLKSFLRLPGRIEEDLLGPAVIDVRAGGPVEGALL